VSYSIRPNEMVGVFGATGSARDELVASLGQAEPHLSAAEAGAAGARLIGSALDYFRAQHGRLVDEAATRIGSALYNGQEAVEAYVRGDAQMAEQYGRASVVFAGDRLPPDLSSAPVRADGTPAPAAGGPLPAIVQGG
jgi:Family of unknown function (DUF6507)